MSVQLSSTSFREPEWHGSSAAVSSALPPTPNGLVKLRDAQPGDYMNFKARLVSFSFRQIRDQAGEKTVMSGFVEDNTSRTSLVSHRLFDTIERDQVYLFKNALVHEFPDSSLALILTEYSRIEERCEDNRRDYYWHPTIGQVNRAIWSVYLNGTVTRIFPTSGLVKRCNSCRQVIYSGNDSESIWSDDAGNQTKN